MPEKLLQSSKDQYYETKWDRIVMKMLRDEVAKNPNVGADLAKGLDFYYHAAMKFAKQLEHEFQLTQNESDSRTSSTHHMQPTMSSAAKSIRNEIPQPVSVAKKVMPSKVSGIIDDYEQKKFTKPIGAENNFDRNLHNKLLSNSIPSSNTNTNTAKRPSLQLDSAKIPKDFGFISVNSTPVEPSMPQTDVPKRTSITGSNQHIIEKKLSEPLIVSDIRKETNGIYPKISEPEIPVEPAYMVKKVVAAEPVKDVLATKVEPPKPSIIELHKPIPPISEPPKIEPKFKPRRSVRCGAICNDGWRSTSTGRGTCSHHGGVREWLYMEVSD